jgi:hypothetical protein
MDDMNNYRGISLLPPIEKMFEKLLADQIIIHLNNLINKFNTSINDFLKFLAIYFKI